MCICIFQTRFFNNQFFDDIVLFFLKVKQYVKDNEDQKPFFIGGELASGKCI